MLRESGLIIADIPIITRDTEGRKSQAFTLRKLSRGYNEDPALLSSGTVAEFRFARAVEDYMHTIKRAKRWDTKPSPAEIAVDALLNTAV